MNVVTQGSTNRRCDMAKYKMPFNQYKLCQKMSQKEFSIWVENVAKESWQQGHAKALEQIPDGAIVIEATPDTMVVETNEDQLRELLLSVSGIGPKLCEKILDTIYETFDGYMSETS